MFNSEIKERYLETRKGSIVNQSKNLFVAAEKLENEYGVDLAEFNIGEISQFMRLGGFAEPNSVRSRLALLSSYGKWYCEQTGKTLDGIKTYKVKDFPYAEYLAPTIIKTPEELVNKIRQVYDFDSGQPAMAALCLSWLGFDIDEMLKLRVEQVDTKAGVILDGSGAVRVSRCRIVSKKSCTSTGKRKCPREPRIKPIQSLLTSLVSS